AGVGAMTLIGSILLPLTAFADPPMATAETSLVASKDRATDDAFQRLFDLVAGLPILTDQASQTVASFLATSPQIERQFRQNVLAATATPASPTSPSPTIRPRSSPADEHGSVTMVLSIPAERLIDALRRALPEESAQPPRQLRFAPGVSSTITTIGRAAAIDQATEMVPNELNFRPGWRAVSSDDIIMTQSAAQCDLRQRLLVWMMRVPLVGGQSIGQLVRQEPLLKDALRRQLDRIASNDFVFEPTGICVLTCVVSADQLSELLRSALTEAGHTMTGPWKPAIVFESTMTFQGFSVAPPTSLTSPTLSRRMEGSPLIDAGYEPRWIHETLTIEASATAPRIASRELQHALAIRMAQIEASRQLWIKLEKLPLPEGQTLGEVIERRADGDRIIAAIHAAIQKVSEPTVDENGTARVRLNVPLSAVWQAL
ncbi:MAG: hypothetical protein FWC56_06205, partial [Phycisphaerae bacterium]|nr:hypothetical protein [Phycisphaerae bacterium]